MSKKIKLVNKKEFVENRYKNFLDKINFFKKNNIGMLKDKHQLVFVAIDYEKETKTNFGIMTDLNKDCEIEGVQKYKDLVLCDKCQKNIFENQFIMFENSFIYHENCFFNEEEKRKLRIKTTNLIISKNNGLKSIFSKKN